MSEKNLKIAARNTPEQLKQMAMDLRRLADEIQAGEAFAIAWTVLYVSGKFDTGWAQPDGGRNLELIGTLECLKRELCSKYDD